MQFDKLLPMIVPLVGVLIGWVLSQLASKRERQLEDRRLIAKVVYHLLRRRRDLVHTLALMRGARELHADVIGLEQHRQKLFKTHLGAPSADDKELFQEVAALDPLLAAELNGQADSIAAMRNVKFQALLSHEALYRQQYGTIEALYEAVIKKTDEAIIAIAARKGRSFSRKVKRSLANDRSQELGDWGKRTKRTLSDAIEGGKQSESTPMRVQSERTGIAEATKFKESGSAEQSPERERPQSEQAAVTGLTTESDTSAPREESQAEEGRNKAEPVRSTRARIEPLESEPVAPTTPDTEDDELPDQVRKAVR